MAYLFLDPATGRESATCRECGSICVTRDGRVTCSNCGYVAGTALEQARKALAQAIRSRVTYPGAIVMLHEGIVCLALAEARDEGHAAIAACREAKEVR